MIPSGSVNALASRLDELIRHPEISPEMERYGREIVEKRFDVKKLHKRLVMIFENLLAEDEEIFGRD